jgi:hypothetical protein
MPVSDSDIRAVVDRLMLEQGSYLAVELLLALDALPYSSYRAWRRGEVASLQEAVTSQVDARAILDTASEWLDALGHTRTLAAYAGWEQNAGIQLRGSTDPEFDALVRMGYEPVIDGEQLDLFTHSAETAALAGLRDALVENDSGAAAKARQQLLRVAPNNPQLNDAVCLGELLLTLAPCSVAAALGQLARLEQEWLPAAERLLRLHSRDFMAPYWHRIATVVEHCPFDPLTPSQHASAIYRRCLDWDSVRRSVLGTDDAVEPVLIARLAEAEYRLRNRPRALELWCQLCWIEPNVAANAFEAVDFPDRNVARLWADLVAQDTGPLDASWLPAWLLLREPGTARTLTIDPGSSPAQITFDVLRSLVHVDPKGTTPSSEAIVLRDRLQSNAPWLLERYLALRTK